MSTASLKSDVNAASSQSGETPTYLSARPNGVFINLSKLYSVGGLDVFVNRMFTGDSRFSELDYEMFKKLLYDPDWLESAKQKSTEVKIAAGMVRFPPQRRMLYKAVKLLEGGRQAEYLFEPIVLEETYEEPVRGEPDESGAIPITRHVSKTRRTVAKLDFDEFVADMWVKGIKYGIDADAVRKVLAASTATRLIFANYLSPTSGSDADIQEVCTELRRDNTPKTRLNGKADLRAFKNRFPHISKGGRLLKKIPRVLGKPGYLVTGEMIEPTIPKDIDFSALTSLGTSVVNSKDGEFIVALLDGFLTIDASSNVISISEKIETDAGISMKTTGDLTLVVDEFVEHGEVQEGRVVNGKHMTFTGDVFGDLISSGGNIRVEGTLNGGRAEIVGGNGNITLGRVFRAVVLAHNGIVSAKYCENCTVIARTIHIEQAVNCEVIGEKVSADVVERCMIAAESIKILSSSESKSRETLITMLIPDLSAFESGIANLEKKIVACKAVMAGIEKEFERLKSDQDFAKYLAIDTKIKSGEITLTSTQLGNWKQMVAKNANAALQLERLRKQSTSSEHMIQESEAEIAKLTQTRDATGTNIGCVVDKVLGQTNGQTMQSASGMKSFAGLRGNQIKTLLQSADGKKARVFSEDDGAINWSYK